jgi:autotransporter-associated beta strand protein
LNNGGVNTTFEVFGSLQGRNNGTVNLGELKGTGSLVGSTAVDNNTTTFSVGGKGTSSTFEGIIMDSNGATGRRAALTKVGAGTLTLTGSNNYTGPTTVTGGTLVLGPSAQEPIFGGGAVATPAGADIQGGMLALGYSGDASALTALVGSTLDAGYDQSPRFSQGAIRSTTLAANHVLGWLDDDSASQVLIRPTVVGDLNLDGMVSISDFIDLASHFGETGTATWADGDVNYDQIVSISDFIDLAANFGSVYSGESFAIAPAERTLLDSFYAANVPEPQALGWLAAAALTFCRRRRMKPANAA